MKKIIFAIVALTLVPTASFAQKIQVGAAKVDVTPLPSQLVNKTDTIIGSICVRAIYMTDGKHPAVLVSVDGDMRQAEEAIELSSRSTGCPVDNYIICGTHSHSPSTGGIGNGHPSPQELQDALVKAVDLAKKNVAPARVGFGTTQIDLNVNRDLYTANKGWSQEANWEGVSDKTLAVLTFMGEDDVPIAVMMNYGMHPVNYFISGVVSPDFPGVASDYVENLFGGKTVALFSQSSSGVQIPILAYTSIFRDGQVKGVLPSANRNEPNASGKSDNVPRQPSFTSSEIPAERLPAHREVIRRKMDYVNMLGLMIGNNAVRTMLYDTRYETNPSIWAGRTVVTCPGRERIDKNGRENYDPGYTDGPDVKIGVGLLRIGNIALPSVSGEIYTEVGMRIKAESPSSKTMVLSLANGPYESGYDYSDNASHHLTIQVIGSRLKPGYAEDGIVGATLKLWAESWK